MCVCIYLICVVLYVQLLHRIYFYVCMYVFHIAHVCMNCMYEKFKLSVLLLFTSVSIPNGMYVFMRYYYRGCV